MKEQETIKIIKTLYPKKCKKINGTLKGGFEDHDCVEGQALDMAISALEKQIPKKPIVKPWDVARCPSCGSGLSEHMGDGYYKHYTHWEYCHNSDCLQKLDWSE